MLRSLAVPLEMIVGAGLALLALWVWHRRKVLEPQRNRCSPVKGGLLRPPGHSLAGRIEDLNWRLLVGILAVVVGFMAVAFSLGSTFMLGMAVVHDRGMTGALKDLSWMSTFNTPNGRTALVGILEMLAFGTLAVLWGFRRLHANLREMHRLQMGLRGEQAVAEEMQTAIRAGYHMFHDLDMGGGGNIDHILVGPGGVFAIETKARLKRIGTDNGPENRVVFDGKEIRFGPSGPQVGPVKQAEGNARWLAGMLSASTGVPVYVSAVIAVPGWWCDRNDFSNVLVRNPRYLAKQIVDARPILQDDQIQRIVYQLDQKCRDVEF